MPNYTLSAPDGSAYTISGPDGATQAQIQAEVLRQYPTAGTPKGTSWGKFLGQNLLEGLGQVGDFVGNGITGGLTGAFSPDEDEQKNLTTMEQGHPILAGATRMVGGAALPVAGEAATAARTALDAGSSATQAALRTLGTVAKGTAWPGAQGATIATANQMDPSGALGTAVGIPMSVTPNPVAAVKNAARGVLTGLQASASPEMRAQVAGAEAISPGNQTFAQTTGAPFIQGLGQGAAGRKTQTANAAISNRLTSDYVDQAKAIAPLGVSNPEVAQQVLTALRQKDDDLAARGDLVYTSGRSVVNRDKTIVPTYNTVAAVDQMVAAANDPMNLAPPDVKTRLKAMADALRAKPAVSAAPGSGLATTEPKPAGVTWGGFYDLRKQINTLYDDVPKSEALSPAMDATFKQLKAGYYADLEAAPAGAAKDMTTKANRIYEDIQNERGVLKDSIVASVLGKDGKLATADPDQAIQNLISMKPAAQAYAREILESYKPEALQALQAQAIQNDIAGAARGSASATLSTHDISKMQPGKIAQSGLFTPAQIAELNKRQDAINTALIRQPTPGNAIAGGSEAMQSGGRILGGFSPVFMAGAAAKYLSGGTFERAINTPEGRNALLAYTGKSADVAKAANLFRAALTTQIQQERQDAQRAQATQGLPGQGSPYPAAAQGPATAAPALPQPTPAQ